MHDRRRSALVTGVAGQDGSYLADLLVDKGYRVVGTSRRAGAATDWRIAHLQGRLEVVQLDLGDPVAVRECLAAVAPDEVYHLAAASRVDRSWHEPMEALVANAGSTLALLEGVRHVAPASRMVIASSCEIFGRPAGSPQSETTPVAPTSPYGVSKAAAFWLAANYRQTHGVQVSSAILYNHESPRRGEEFVTRKIVRGVANIVVNAGGPLVLGNLEGRRDWGFAGDYVDALWRMAQASAPTDLVIGTGIAHSVREFCELAFASVGLDYRQHVTSDPALLRPADAMTLVADATRAREELDWRPTMSFAALVGSMVAAEVERQRGGARV